MLKVKTFELHGVGQIYILTCPHGVTIEVYAMKADKQPMRYRVAVCGNINLFNQVIDNTDDLIEYLETITIDEIDLTGKWKLATRTFNSFNRGVFSFDDSYPYRFKTLPEVNGYRFIDNSPDGNMYMFTMEFEDSLTLPRCRVERMCQQLTNGKRIYQLGPVDRSFYNNLQLIRIKIIGGGYINMLFTPLGNTYSVIVTGSYNDVIKSFYSYRDGNSLIYSVVRLINKLYNRNAHFNTGTPINVVTPIVALSNNQCSGITPENIKELFNEA